MRIIARKRFVEYYTTYPELKTRLQEIHILLKSNDFNNCNEIQNLFSDAECIGKNRVILNIKRNKHRLILKIDYKFKKVFIKFIGTHQEYDKIDPKTI